MKVKRYSIYATKDSDVIRTDAPRADDWRLLKRLKVRGQVYCGSGAEVKNGLIVDVETTGLDPRDEVIQLALLPFTYEPSTGLVLKVMSELAFEGLREPTIKISHEAQQITGISWGDVQGKRIRSSLVNSAVEKADLIVAHNAQFDRPMVEKHWPCFATKPWACTYGGVDWTSEGFSAGKLDYLGMKFGWFYDGHTALTDCEACLALLSMRLPVGERFVMKSVHESSEKEEWLIPAYGAPFERKDALKQRGYRWRGKEMRNGKVWWTITDNLEAELQWLRVNAGVAITDLSCVPIDGTNRFSERIWSFDDE